ncbi:hypothetical protein B296_00028893 [Ensete ventricosum]|uniref:Uncharacterized protein n=1 Tax=Ensete ventricosum TaxID=4639 RepID=A0A426ZT95_ENSVE|nr:hypothetical protein B296_00028893 [Ensete ventricosum]
MSSPFPINNTVAVSLLDNSYKTDSCVNKPNVQEPSSECSSFNKTTNGTDHKTLKVRIKMVDNNLVRNNAAIYSGLGLDYSPSSSFEDSPDGNEGVFPGFRDLPDESPRTIIQVMTCFAVPGAFLLSPLQNNLFHLTEKDISYIKQSKRHRSYKGLPETTLDFADITTHSREVKGQMKQAKARGQKGRPSEIKDSEGKDNIAFGREIESETHSGRELTSNSFNMPASSISKDAIKEARPIVGNAVKIDTKLLDQLSEMKKTSLKDQSSFTGSVKELFESTTNNTIDNTGNEVMNSRGQLNAKVSMSKKALEEGNKDYLKDKKSDLQRERRSNIEKDLDITDTHSSGHKRSNEQVSIPTDRFKPGSSPSRERILQQKEQKSDRKKKLKVSHTNSEPFGEILKDIVSGNVIATSKEKKKASHSKADNSQKKTKVLKPRKDLSGSSFSESHGNVIWDVKAEEFENGVSLLNRSKGKQKAVKCDHSGKSKKHSKSENQRGIDQDDLRTSKKARKESLQYTNKSCTSDNVTAKAFEVTDVGGYSTKVITNDQTRWDNNPLLKDSKCDIKSNSSAPFKKSSYEVQSITNCESKNHVSASDVEKSSNLDVSVKKRKMKEWQESQQNQEALVSRQHVVENGVIVKGALGENEPVKDRNFELERKRSKTSKLNSKMDKNCTMTKMSLRAGGEHLPDGMDEALYVVEKEHRFSQSQENAASLRDLEFDPLKRDIAYAQPPVAANSSSSMVSGSHKSRSNFRETRGSPVESVSSSPLRILGIQKPSCKRTSEQTDYAINADSSLLESPKRCSDGEVDGGNGHSGKFRKQISIQQQSFESHRVAGSGTLDSLGETFDYLEKEKIQLPVGKSEARLHVKNGATDDFSPTELGEQHPYKDDIQDRGKVNKDHLVNESSQQKSSKSSLSSKGKHRGSKSDLGKNKIRVSGPYTGNKDFHSTNNGSSCRFEATSGYCEDEKDVFDEQDWLGKKEPTSRWTTSRQYNGTNFIVQENTDANAPTIHSNQQKDIESKVPVCGSRHIKPEFQVKPSFHNGKELDHNHLDRIDFPEPHPGLGKSQLQLTVGCKQETQYRIPHMVSSPLMASRLDIRITDASKVVKQHRQPEIHDRSHHANMRHATPSGPDTSSPLRKEHYSAVMKEARDLKHSANRLKVNITLSCITLPIFQYNCINSLLPSMDFLAE